MSPVWACAARSFSFPLDWSAYSFFKNNAVLSAATPSKRTGPETSSSWERERFIAYFQHLFKILTVCLSSYLNTTKTHLKRIKAFFSLKKNLQIKSLIIVRAGRRGRERREAGQVLTTSSGRSGET